MSTGFGMMLKRYLIWALRCARRDPALQIFILEHEVRQESSGLRKKQEMHLKPLDIISTQKQNCIHKTIRDPFLHPYFSANNMTAFPIDEQGTESDLLQASVFYSAHLLQIKNMLPNVKHFRIKLMTPMRLEFSFKQISNRSYRNHCWMWCIA